MSDSYTELEHLETEIVQFIEVLAQKEFPFPETLLCEYASLVASYSQQINCSLKSYQDLQEREIKLEKKALVKFAYEFLHILMELVHNFEHGLPMNPLLLQYLQNLNENKSKLLESKYYPEAVREYECFYNPEVRKLLEYDLEKRILQRFN